MDEEAKSSTSIRESSTTPTDVKVMVVGLDEDLAVPLAEVLKDVVLDLGTHFDLQGLDGVTVAANCSQALLELDRGYETSHRVTPSNTYGAGVAMTPSVIRDGQLRSHILFEAANLIGMLQDRKQTRVMNLIAHECAHVEITRYFDSAFPGVLLKRKGNALDVFRWDVTLACWDEFAACWRSAPFGSVHTDEYEEVFLRVLDDTRQKANASITSYRLHADISRVLSEVCGAYGNLMKYSAYHLGNLEGNNLSWRQMPNSAERLAGHWFQPFFESLEGALKTLAKSYGSWVTEEPFEVLGEIAESLVADGGMYFYKNTDGTVGVDIPLTPETTP